MATAPCITLTLLQHHSELPNLPLPLPRQHFWASRPKHAHLWPWADYLGCWGGFETRLMINRSSVTDLLFSLLPTAAGTLLHDLTLILALLFPLLGSRVSLRDWHGHYMSRNDRRAAVAKETPKHSVEMTRCFVDDHARWLNVPGTLFSVRNNWCRSLQLQWNAGDITSCCPCWIRELNIKSPLIQQFTALKRQQLAHRLP